jgi:tetratricopeptide (TPR) repeat protein
LVLYRRRWPLLLALWVCHLVLLLAALGLTESPHYICDRYDYIPAILWSVLLLAGLCRLRAKLYGLAVAALVAAVTLQSSMTIPQIRVWHDSESLFRHTLATLGDDPYRAIIYRRLGMVYAEKGYLDQAIEQYRRSLAIGPGAIANRLLAEALEEQGQLEPALFRYGEALKQQPDDARLQGRIGFVLARLGRSRDAVAHLREALRLQPDSASDLNLLAWILATDADATLRDVPTAVRLAERACALTGHREAEFLMTLAAAYFQAGRYAEAEHEADRALVAARASGDAALIARCQGLRDHLPQAKAAAIPP